MTTQKSKRLSDAVIIAIISGVVSIVGLAMTLMVKAKQTEMHQMINSRMDEMLKLTKDKSEAEGNLKGREELKTEQDSLKK